MGTPFKMKGWSPFTQKKILKALKTEPSKTGTQSKIGLKSSKETDDMSFNKAFGNARDKGVQEFIWRGDKYHTKTEE